MNKKEHSLHLLKEWISLRTVLRAKALENTHLIRIVEDTKDILSFEDLDSIFYFKVYSPVQGSDHKISVTAFYKPRSTHHPKETSVSPTTDVCIDIFKTWLGLVEEYENTALSPDDELTKQYIEEFEAEFEIIDEDADTKAFDLQKQIFLLEYINHVEETIEKSVFVSEENKPALIEEARKLKQDLPNLTKRKTIKRLSTLLAKARKQGIELIKGIWSEGKKEVIKHVVNHMIDNVDVYIQKVIAYSTHA